MSVLTTKALLTAPSAATGLTLANSGTNWVYGPWTQFIAVPSSVVQIAGFTVHPGSWSGLSMDIDIGIGLAGIEASLGSPMRVELSNSGGRGMETYMLPVPIGGLIAAGAAVSLRQRCNSASATPGVALLYYYGLDSDHQIPYVTGAHPVAAAPATVASSGVAWTNGSWGVLIASLTNNAYIYGLGILPASLTGVDLEFDIGTGGAGSETVVTTLRGGYGDSATARMEYLHLPAPLLVVAGTRVSCRCRQSSATANNHGVALIYYDAPAPVTPPPPATDYPCGLTTPVFWGALSVAGSVVQFAKQPLRDPSTYYGGYKAPRLLHMSRINRVASDWLTGAWSAQTASMTLADSDHYFRTFPRPSLLNSTAYFYLESETTRLAQGNPALLFHGPIYDDPLTEHLTYTVQANDYVSVDYNLFKDDKLIPQRTIDDDFPNRPNASNGLGVPIIGGTVSETGGGVRVIDVGNLVIGGVAYAIGLIAGHACAGGVTSLYQGGALLTAYGTDVWAPGHANWTDIQPSGALYFDINGHRYTIVAFKNTVATNFQNGSQPVYANVSGMEPNADGTGAVITDLLVLYKYLMVQWLTQSYASGAWLAGLTFPFYPGTLGTTAPIVDETSFTTASATASTYLGGGFLGAFVIGANGVRKSVREVLRDCNVSCNVLMGLNAQSQIFVKMFDRTRATFIGSTRTLSWRRDILKNPPFALSRNPAWFANDLGYQYAANYRNDGTGDWNGSNSQGHAPSKVKYGVVTARRFYPLIRDASTADAVAGAQLNFAGPDPLRIVKWTMSLCGMAFDLLSGVPITHYGGTGANGWTANAVWITSQELDPSNGTVSLTGIDVEALLS